MAGKQEPGIGEPRHAASCLIATQHGTPEKCLFDPRFNDLAFGLTGIVRIDWLKFGGVVVMLGAHCWGCSKLGNRLLALEAKPLPIRMKFIPNFAVSFRRVGHPTNPSVCDCWIKVGKIHKLVRHSAGCPANQFRNLNHLFVALMQLAIRKLAIKVEYDLELVFSPAH